MVNNYFLKYSNINRLMKNSSFFYNDKIFNSREKKYSNSILKLLISYFNF